MSQYQFVDGVRVTLDNHEYYPTKDAVLEQIKENEKQIAEHKEKLFAMVCGNVKDLFSNVDYSGYHVDPIDSAKVEFDLLFDREQGGLEYLIAHNVDLWYLYNNFDKNERD